MSDFQKTQFHFFEKKKFIFRFFQPKFWKWKIWPKIKKITILSRSRLGRYKNSTKIRKNELKSRFFDVLPKSVFYCEKEILWRIELCDKCSKVVCSCQKNITLNYAIWEVFKSRLFLPKILRFDLRYVRSVQVDIFSCQKKKRRFTLFREPNFFPAKKTPDFRHSNRFYVTPHHSTSRVPPTNTVFMLEKGLKTRKTKSAGNWMTYFRARF